MEKLFIPVKDLRSIDEFLPELNNLLKPYRKVAVTATIQFNHRVNEVVNALKGHEVVTAPPVLGCKALIPESDCTVIITTGVFHAVKVALTTLKPVFILSPNGVEKLDDKLINTFLKKQAVRISRVLDAKIIGVLVSTKSGQNHESLAHEIIKKLESSGREAYLFVANDLSPSQLNDFPVDAWINTACPRIAEDEFDKPIVNWNEVEKHL